ncbi:hypothetical protein Landi51_11650 [Colletotrichum acutatum]
MTLQPSLDFEPPFGGQICLACRFPSLTDESSPNGQIARQNLREAKRPIKRVFELFEHSAWDDQPTNIDHSIGEHDSLYEGSLNLEVLLFGRIRIQWVDTLSEHLKFDLVSRRLSIFRLPTFCVLSALRKEGKETTPLLDSINEGFMPTAPENRYQNYVTLEQEILVSYRLLFGQSARSRKLIRSDLQKLEKSGQPFDNLLYTLCGPKKEVDKLPRRIWPVGCRDFEQGKLLESDVYSAQSDFPRLGYRLINLQRFSLRQKPRRLTDLWRDRRNPLQWYTFWAVLFRRPLGRIRRIRTNERPLVVLGDLSRPVHIQLSQLNAVPVGRGRVQAGVVRDVRRQGDPRRIRQAPAPSPHPRRRKRLRHSGAGVASLLIAAHPPAIPLAEPPRNEPCHQVISKRLGRAKNDKRQQASGHAGQKKYEVQMQSFRAEVRALAQRVARILFRG